MSGGAGMIAPGAMPPELSRPVPSPSPTAERPPDSSSSCHAPLEAIGPANMQTATKMATRPVVRLTRTAKTVPIHRIGPQCSRHRLQRSHGLQFADTCSGGRHDIWDDLDLTDLRPGRPGPAEVKALDQRYAEIADSLQLCCCLNTLGHEQTAHLL